MPIKEGIYIEFTPATSLGFEIPGKLHSYLAYHDGKGNTEVIRGGPTYGPTYMAGSDIQVEVGIPIEQSKDAYASGEKINSRPRSELDLKNRNTKSVWSEMKARASWIDRAKIDYDVKSDISGVKGQNSNSLTRFVLEQSNINPIKSLPKGISLDQIPGYKNNLSNPYDKWDKLSATIQDTIEGWQNYLPTPPAHDFDGMSAIHFNSAVNAQQRQKATARLEDFHQRRENQQAAVRGLLGTLGAKPENIGGALKTSLDDLGLAAEGLRVVADFLGGSKTRPQSKRIGKIPLQTTNPKALKAAARFIDNGVVNRVMKSNAYNLSGHPSNKAAKTVTRDFFQAAYPGTAKQDEFGRLRSTPNVAGAWANAARTGPAKDNPIRDFEGLSPSQYGASPIEKAIAIQAETRQRQRAQEQVEARAQAQDKAAVRSNGISRNAVKEGWLGSSAEARPARHGQDKLGGNKQTSLDGATIDLSKDMTPASAGLKFDYSRIDAVIADRNRAAKGLPTLASKNLLKHQTLQSRRGHEGDKAISGQGGRPNRENYTGRLGVRGHYDAKGNYRSGANSRGKPTGGVRLDKKGREINAFGTLYP